MTLVFASAALVAKLGVIRTNFLQVLTLKLFKNDITPLITHSAGDYTEANFDGYAAQAANDWGAPALNGGNQAETETGVHTFLMTGAVTPNTIYGYFLVDAGGALIGADRNPAGGFLMDAAGKTFSVRLTDVLD